MIKTIKCILTLMLAIILVPVNAALAEEVPVTVNKNEVKAYVGETGSFTIDATEVTGKIKIVSKDTDVVTVSVNSDDFVATTGELWVEEEIVTVNVAAIGQGSTKIEVDLVEVADKLENQVNGKLEVTAYSLVDNAITYNLNGGTNAEANPETFTMDEEVVLADPTRTGYTFAGWYEDAAFTGDPVTAIAIYTTEDVELFAKWVGNSYTVEYKTVKPANAVGQVGVSGTLSEIRRYDAEEEELLTPPYSFEHFTFVGWNTKEDGTGEMYLPGEKYNNLATEGTVVLYSIYKLDTYTITYVLDGGTNAEENPAEYTFEDEVVLADPYKDGYEFLGWFNADGEKVESIAKGSVGAVTLTASWKKVDEVAPVIENFSAVRSENNIRVRANIIEENIASLVLTVYEFDDEEVVNSYEVALDNVDTYYTTVFEVSADKVKVELVVTDISYNTARAEYVLTEEDKVADALDDVWSKFDADTYVYTGSAIKPVVKVYEGTTLLTLNKDYTVSYKNNTKVGTATVTIKGKGNYELSRVETFEIVKANLNSEAFDISITSPVANNKKVQKVAPVVNFNGKKLSAKGNYLVEYPDEGEDAYKAAGTYNVTITGQGNFEGTVTLPYTILSTEQKLVSKLSVAKIADVNYDGTAKTPVLTVKDGKKVLTEGVDYNVTYANNVEVGKATATIVGTGDLYAGTKTVTFNIKGVSISKATVSGLQTVIYDGDAKVQDITVKLNKVELVEGEDYAVSYVNNVKVGKATVVITGLNKYTGTVKKSFTIKALAVKEADVDYLENVEFSKAKAKNVVTVKVADRELIEGKDYTVSYSNNSSVAEATAKKAPSFTIKFKGNYSGSLSGYKFNIVTRAIDAEGIQLTVNDVKYNTKNNGWKSSVKLTDNNSSLKASTDFDKNVVYTYLNDTVVVDGSNKAKPEITRKAGEVVAATDILSKDTVVKVTLTGIKNYTGEISTTYRIVVKSISNLSVKVANKVYTGAPIKLNKSDIVIKDGKTVLGSDDFEIVSSSYKNNVNKGKATVTIRGVGQYGGYKTVSFNIKAKGILGLLK